MGELYVLFANPPSTEDSVPIGVVLRDPEADKLYVRLRQDWDLLIRDEDTWYFEELERAILDLERELGSKAAMDLVLQGANGVTCDEPQKVLVGNYPAGLNRLYAKWVPAAVRKFETHLPLYSLRSAAGKFLDNSEVEPEGWLEIPDASGLRQGQFVARIQGTSMEPVIPDGSLAVFDTEGLGGSRIGKLVLVEERGRGSSHAYTLKRYTRSGSGEERSIVLEPLNPAHEEIRLTPEDDRYQVVGIFVRVLDPDLAEGVVDG